MGYFGREQYVCYQSRKKDVKVAEPLGQNEVGVISHNRRTQSA